MKNNTFRRYKFTADLYTFTTSTDGEGGDIRSYELDRTVDVHAITSGQGRLFVFFQAGDDDVERFDQLFNLKDAGGSEIMDNGIFQIESVEPTLNLWGRRDGFKARAAFIGYTA